MRVSKARVLASELANQCMVSQESGGRHGYNHAQHERNQSNNFNLFN